ncbi:AMP-binding protein [Alicyclobacillus vulcanalis]|uniref:Long-chain acyl-CoA synthetase n=1 Tax=Alicyclobacillus vulcanalis TaxID=252246 RepID=A0A1N7KVR7_9BACL|nr:AMP-binding protein [Alicyclobacillus vulcanalis]SIS65685.1 long-chain acyl-CoA synthetase [Alicyclobacillus vulcanalis]
MQQEHERVWLKSYPADIPATLAIPAVTMADVLEATARRLGDRPAIYYFDTSWSWKELNEWADRFAALLAGIGVGPGDRVAVCTQNNPHFPLVCFGAWKRGAIVVPISPMLKAKEMQLLLADSGAAVLVMLDQLYQAEGRDAIQHTDVRAVFTCHESDFLEDPGVLPTSTSQPKTLDLETDLLQALSKVDPAAPSRAAVGPEDVAFLVYTSGTTGAPKGAMNLHRNLVFNANVYRTWMKLSENDIILAVAPLFHITGIVGHLCASAVSGAPMLLLHRFEPETYLTYIERYRPTMTVGSITAFIALLNAPSAKKRDIRSLVKCYSGGAPIAPPIVEEFERVMGPYIHNIYGLTESNSPVTMIPLGTRAPVDPSSGALSIGLPVSNCDARIVDLEDPARSVPFGEQGQLAIRGPMLFSGYWNRPDATREAFHDGWFLTGDVAVMDGAGYVYIVDRKKDLINVSGFKVWPRDVEDVLYQHPAVREAAVIGVPDAYRGETVKAFVALKPEYAGRVSPEEIVAFCKARMAAYKYPRAVEFMDEIPKTATGKFLRRSLRDRELRSQPSQP